MIFIRRKGHQPTPSSAVPEEAEDEDIGEEEGNVGSRSEQAGEASTSRRRQSKLNELLTEFEEFNAQTQINFEALKQQLQSNQAENLSNFGTIAKMIEGLQQQIQAMQRQPFPSPTHFSTPTAKATLIPSPIGDYANEPHSPIPMASPSPVHDACGTEEPVINDESMQVPHEVDTQIVKPEHQSMQHSLEIIHINDSDEESTHDMAEASKVELTENPIPQSEPCLDPSDNVIKTT